LITIGWKWLPRTNVGHLNINIEQQGKQRGRERENGRDRVMERTNEMKD
jgi:hypothetical protein